MWVSSWWLCSWMKRFSCTSTISLTFSVKLLVVLSFVVKSICEGFCRKGASVLMSCVKSLIWVFINRHLNNLLFLTVAGSFQTSSSSPVTPVSVPVYDSAWESVCLISPSFHQMSCPLPALFNLNKHHIPNYIIQRR